MFPMEIRIPIFQQGNPPCAEGPDGISQCRQRTNWSIAPLLASVHWKRRFRSDPQRLPSPAAAEVREVFSVWPCLALTCTFWVSKLRGDSRISIPLRNRRWWWAGSELYSDFEYRTNWNDIRGCTRSGIFSATTRRHWRRGEPCVSFRDWIGRHAWFELARRFNHSDVYVIGECEENRSNLCEIFTLSIIFETSADYDVSLLISLLCTEE